jgi:Uma2 family endonuclease
MGIWYKKGDGSGRTKGVDMSKTAIKIGPADNGRRMSLKDFEHAEVQEGYVYELARGIIVVSDVPKPKHLAMVTAARRQLAAIDLTHPGMIYTIAAGSECKILLPEFESERHPDLAIYKTPPPSNDDCWDVWLPELALEVISPSSQTRDYQEKPEEYLAAGIREYWIIDGLKEEMLVLRRVGKRWNKKTIRPPEIYTTRLLPGLEFSCAKVFEAARAIEE